MDKELVEVVNIESEQNDTNSPIDNDTLNLVETEIETQPPATTPTPLPKGGVLAACLIFGVEAFQYNIDDRVLDFGIVDKIEDTGYYVGMLAGCYAIAQFFSSFIFGALADHFSKRSVVAISCLGCLVTILGFGFSVNYTMAIICRTLCGLFNGNMATARAYMSDITDASNQSIGFSYLGVAWGAGGILGPMIGGFLSRPTKSFDSLQNLILFEKFPYALPCLFCALVMVIGLIACVLFMKHVPKQRRPSLSMEQGDDTKYLTMSTQQKMIRYVKSVYKVLKDEQVVLCAALYFFCSASDTMQEELFPLWSIVSTENGGLDLSNVKLGIANTVMGALCLTQPIVYPPLASKIGHLNCFRVGFVLNLLLVFTTQLNLMRVYGGEVVMWIGIVMWCVVRVIVMLLIFASVSLLVNNSAPVGNSGLINGFSSSASCFARTIATLSAGPLFSLCANNVYLQNVPFIISCGMIPAAALLMSTRLPPSINTPKTE
ncbi:peptide/nitrate transporter [Acrasis kona]|uniref:Peptide/nitrate transporter n=1 Tax=Acrasis kona TaxID=1008807 RepID=A0AAW2Z0D2_9EUKA